MQMKHPLRKLCNKVFLQTSLLSLCFNLTPAHAENESFKSKIEEFFSNNKENAQEKHTLNFSAVPMAEYVQFVAKITELNFVFDPADLQFPVTIISNAPITRESVLSLLAQTLRANGLTLVEDGKTTIITRATGITQAAPIFTGENGGSLGPIATRLFSIKNSSTSSVAAIIQPMLSQKALMATDESSHTLVVTDVLSNLQQIADLIAAIEREDSPLEIEIFEPKSMAAKELATLSSQLLTPFALGTPLLLLPQEDANKIFIIATPRLANKSLQVMKDLDAPLKDGKSRPISLTNTLIYKIANRSHADLVPALMQIRKELSQKENPPVALLDALSSVRWIQSSNALFFTATEGSIAKIEEILKTLDAPVNPAQEENLTTFRLYKIKNANEEQIRSSLKLMASDLAKLKDADKELIESIESMRWMKETDTLFFTGSTRCLTQIFQLLPVLDVAPENSQVALTQTLPESEFKLFYPKAQKGEVLFTKVQQVGDKLQKSNLADPGFLRTLNSLQWLEDSNALIATGDKSSLTLLEGLVASLDISENNLPVEQTKVFTVSQLTEPHLKKTLKKLQSSINAKTPTGADLSSAIQSVRFIDNHHFSATGTPSALQEIAVTLNAIDTKEAKTASTTVFITLHNIAPEELLDNLKKLELDESGAVAQVIATAKPVPEYNALVVSGSPEAIEEFRTFVTNYDSTTTAASFKMYPNISKELFDSLENYKAQLIKSVPKGKTAQLSFNYDSKAKTLYVRGSKQYLDEVEALIKRSQDGGKLPDSSVFFYTPSATVTKQEFDSAINYMLSQRKVGTESSANYELLLKTLKNYKWVGKTVMFEGPPATLKDIKSLLAAQFQDGSISSTPTSSNSAINKGTGFTTYAIYTIRGTVPAEELKTKLQHFLTTILETGVKDDALSDSIMSISIADDGKELIIPGDAAVTDRIVTYLNKFDVGSSGSVGLSGIEFDVYKLQYQQGSDILNSLKKIASELSAVAVEGNQSLIAGINSLQWISTTNSLIAIEKRETVEKIKKLISQLDVPLRQVFIEVLVIETSLSNSQSFGLEWGGKGQFKNKLGWGYGNFPPTNANGTSVSGLIPPLSGINAANPVSGTGNNSIKLQDKFNLGVIGDLIFHKGKSFASLATLVNALQQDSDSTIVLNPKIIAQDNHNSTIFSGQNLPFVGSSIQTIPTGGGTSNSSSVEYRDIGVNLSIKPLLGEDNIVTLDIVTDITELINIAALNGGTNGITTSHTSMNTKVHVPDQHFLVLSGMIRDTKTHSKAGIPCLGGLPAIGAAFSQNDRLSSKSNVIIFVRPHIINSHADYVALTQRQEEVYKENAGMQILKEEFDAGLEIVKTKENK